MLPRSLRSIGFAVLLVSLVWLAGGTAPTTSAGKPDDTAVDRSPVDLALTADEKWLLTANQTSATVSLVQMSSGKVVAEVACGKRPSAIVEKRLDISILPMPRRS